MTSTVRLTEWTSCGGCAAKWGAAPLSQLVRDLAVFAPTAELLVGLAPFDDAAVFRLTDDLALVSTTDFFPPLVDDPADFGAIAAANACSDVFAMGGRVVLALNVAAFPEALPPEVVAAVLAAAAEVVVEAGGVVAGGHTIRSDEPIFGLAVQGLVHPDRVWTKAGARPGDVLVLSKPLGTGIVLAGGEEAAQAGVVTGMRTLNRAAAETLAAGDVPPSAVTDVTGFGVRARSGGVAGLRPADVRRPAGGGGHRPPPARRLHRRRRGGRRPAPRRVGLTKRRSGTGIPAIRPGSRCQNGKIGSTRTAQLVEAVEQA